MNHPYTNKEQKTHVQWLCIHSKNLFHLNTVHKKIVSKVHPYELLHVHLILCSESQIKKLAKNTGKIQEEGNVDWVKWSFINAQVYFKIYTFREKKATFVKIQTRQWLLSWMMTKCSSYLTWWPCAWSKMTFMQICLR